MKCNCIFWLIAIFTTIIIAIPASGPGISIFSLFPDKSVTPEKKTLYANFLDIIREQPILSDYYRSLTPQRNPVSDIFLNLWYGGQFFEVNNDVDHDEYIFVVTIVYNIIYFNILD